MTHSYETWLIHMRHDSFIWDMTHSYETWLIRIRYNLWPVRMIHMRRNSFVLDTTHLYETWLIHMRRWTIKQLTKKPICWRRPKNDQIVCVIVGNELKTMRNFWPSEISGNSVRIDCTFSRNQGNFNSKSLKSPHLTACPVSQASFQVYDSKKMAYSLTRAVL